MPAILTTEVPLVVAFYRKYHRAIFPLACLGTYPCSVSRSNRVDVVEEALAYSGAAHRHNPNCDLLAIVGEFAPNRLEKILSNCPPCHPHPPLSAAVHFAPNLISKGLGENGRLVELKGFDWLISRTFEW